MGTLKRTLQQVILICLDILLNSELVVVLVFVITHVHLLQAIQENGCPQDKTVLAIFNFINLV